VASDDSRRPARVKDANTTLPTQLNAGRIDQRSLFD
jgi:hypothetical protein